MAPDGPGKKPDSLARAFVSHPNTELLQVHNPDRFGCSGCHWGNGRATTGEVKGHGRHKYWLWPLFERENIEAGCQQCHAKDRVTQGAETLNLGRDLFYERGCVGCHRYEGFDRETDALSGSRQTTTQLEDQIIGNEKQIRQDTEAANQAADDAEAQRLLAHAESLRVTNSLLAARNDQLNLQSKYLMQDQKKIGPNLKDVRLKLRKEWVPVWLKDPQAFRPGTKMPTFWRFGVDQDGEEQIKAISAYLWQESFARQGSRIRLAVMRPTVRSSSKHEGVLVVTPSASLKLRLAATLLRIFSALAKRQTSNTSCVGFITRASVGRPTVQREARLDRRGLQQEQQALRF